MNTINFHGKNWRVHTETETKLVCVSLENVVLKWRKKTKLTQREAADKLGISQAQLARIENGQRTCAPALIQKIQNGL
jgi:predicted transcriptional regulator